MPYFSELENDRYDYCFVDNFGNGYHMPNNSYSCDFQYLNGWIKEQNIQEKEFFEKNGITITQAKWKYYIEKSKEEIEIKKIKNIAIWLSLCISIFFFVFGIIYIKNHYANPIRNFFVNAHWKINLKTYLVILASITTIALICIAIKICL